jgi:hypothetical protein
MVLNGIFGKEVSPIPEISSQIGEATSTLVHRNARPIDVLVVLNTATTSKGANGYS